MDSGAQTRGGAEIRAPAKKSAAIRVYTMYIYLLCIMTYIYIYIYITCINIIPFPFVIRDMFSKPCRAAQKSVRCRGVHTEIHGSWLVTTGRIPLL